jgi:hypothetical protein
MCVVYILAREPHGKMPLEIPKHRWKDNIKIDVGEIGYERMNKAQCWAFVNTVMNLRFHELGDFLTR